MCGYYALEFGAYTCIKHRGRCINLSFNIHTFPHDGIHSSTQHASWSVMSNSRPSRRCLLKANVEGILPNAAHFVEVSASYAVGLPVAPLAQQLKWAELPRRRVTAGAFWVDGALYCIYCIRRRAALTAFGKERQCFALSSFLKGTGRRYFRPFCLISIGKTVF